MVLAPLTAELEIVRRVIADVVVALLALAGASASIIQVYRVGDAGAQSGWSHQPTGCR